MAKPPSRAPKAAPGAVRIISGAWRGRKLAVPEGHTIRPTTDRVREALFNRLAHAFDDFRLPGARVLDIFAGTGALGLEALSRGAAYATFLDRNPEAVALLQRNVATLGAEDRATVMNADGAHLPRAANPCDLAFLDPPYHEGLIAPALQGLARQGWLKPGALVVAESDDSESVAATSDYDILDRRAYGRVAITILKFAA